MTSSERSLRLCAFSVFKAKICHATSCSAMTRAVMDLAPRRHGGLKAMAPVGSPETTAWCNDSNDGVEKTPSLTNNVGQPFVVSVGEIAVETAWARSCRWAESRKGLMTAKRFLIEAHHAASSLLYSFRGFLG